MELKVEAGEKGCVGGLKYWGHAVQLACLGSGARVGSFGGM